MNVFLMSVLNSLVQATAGVTATAIAVWLLLRLCRVQSSTVQRFAWLLALLPGVIVWRMPVVLPILPAMAVADVDSGPTLESLWQGSNQSANGISHEDSMRQSWAVAAAPTVAALVCWAVLGAWALGMVMLAGRSVGSYVAFVRRLPTPLLAPARWSMEMHEVCAELAIPRPIALQVTQGLGPALYLAPGGYRLLVPQAVWGQLTPQQRRTILRHELAHYVRGDLWKSLLARILAWPQWFNPLAWLAIRRFEEAAEWACDDAALAMEGEAKFDYLRALLQLGTSSFSTPTLQAAAHGGSLQCRVRRLLSPTGKDSRMKKFVVIALALALSAGGFARIQFATAQSPTAENDSAKAEPAKKSAASLLSNGGFEESRNNSEDPEAWHATRIPKTAGHYVLAASSKVAHSGKRSVFLEIGESHPAAIVHYNWTAVAEGWKAGETYELSGWIKTENANRTAFLMAQCWDEETKDGKIIGGASTQFVCPVKGTADWTRVTTRLNIPEGTTVVRIRAGLSSQENPGAKAWLDDISLVPAPAAVTASK